MHVLLIEDDLDLGAALTQALRSEGVTCEWLRTLRDGAAFRERNHYDCVLLDLTLPDGQGFGLLQQWRDARISVPVIVVTASAALADRLAGLDAGADDYLGKPFAIPELVARLQVVTRRAAQLCARLWSIGSLRIDETQHRVWRDGAEVNLTPHELDLLLILARAIGQVVPKQRLAQALNPLGDPVDFAAIDLHIHHLRRKLGGGIIRTVRGVGWLLPVDGGDGH